LPAPSRAISIRASPIRRCGAFEERLAALEGGEQCVAFASGMAAITAVFMACLKPGDHILSSRSLFGTTHVLYEKYLRKFGIEVTLVDIADLDQWRAAVASGNPLPVC
jgi:O-succinylhomoserine sulfhydrylase